MDTVQSVTGPITAEQMGLTLPHEHVFINLSLTEGADGYMTVWEERVDDVERFVAAGGRTLWDVTNGELSDYAAPVYFDRDAGRQAQNGVTGSRSVANVMATKALAEQTGVQVVLGTGHYHQAYLDQGWWERTSTNQIADHLLADLLDEIPGTGVRAGFLGEIASDRPVITPDEERSFRAAGRAAVEAGVMVSTHAPTFPTGEAQIDILVSEGVDPERIVVGHADTVKDVRYCLDVLARGAYVQFDCMMVAKAGGRINRPELDRRISYLKQLVDAGHGRKILLSQDVCQRSHQAAFGGPGLTFVLEEFADAAVLAGIDPDVLREMSVDNPRRAMFGV
jgi:phosphotriesterase-related protein